MNAINSALIHTLNYKANKKSMRMQKNLFIWLLLIWRTEKKTENVLQMEQKPIINIYPCTAINQLRSTYLASWMISSSFALKKIIFYDMVWLMQGLDESFCGTRYFFSVLESNFSLLLMFGIK